MNRWNKEELEFLQDNYDRLNPKKISEELKRSLQSIYLKAFDLGLKKGRWNEENKLNKEKVIAMLIEQKNKMGKSPSVREIPISLKSACQRHFGNFNNAKKAAGLDLREFIKTLPKNSLNPSKELAYITGLLLGDGSFRYQKSKYRTSYVIIYATKDKELMDFFLDNFEKWSKHRPKKVSVIKGGYKVFPGGNYSYYNKVYVVQIGFKKAWEVLKKFKDNPLICLQFFQKNLQSWLLKGLWDAEGCIGLSKAKYLRIHFSNSDPNIIKLYTEMLKNFNFEYSIYKIKNGFNIDVLKSKEKVRFIKLINGITIKRKINKVILKELNYMKQPNELHTKSL